MKAELLNALLGLGTSYSILGFSARRDVYFFSGLKNA
jgi:hypothetical protein